MQCTCLDKDYFPSFLLLQNGTNLNLMILMLSSIMEFPKLMAGYKEHINVDLILAE